MQIFKDNDLSAHTPLILTLLMDDRSQAFFDQQRQLYFPKHLNFIPAHLTLFHHLPGEKKTDICVFLQKLALDYRFFKIDVTGFRFLGKGVAYKLESDTLGKLHHKMVAHWRPCLTPQDQQKFQPHITVQNKAAPDKAKLLLGTLEEHFMPFSVEGRGLQLWHYLGGPWQLCETFLFGE